jgi:hypothetical protein
MTPYTYTIERHEQFAICRIVEGQPVEVSRHLTQDDAETAMLAMGERYPCGGERYLILRQLEAGSR